METASDHVKIDLLETNSGSEKVKKKNSSYDEERNSSCDELNEKNSGFDGLKVNKTNSDCDQVNEKNSELNGNKSGYDEESVSMFQTIFKNNESNSNNYRAIIPDVIPDHEHSLNDLHSSDDKGICFTDSGNTSTSNLFSNSILKNNDSFDSMNHDCKINVADINGMKSDFGHCPDTTTSSEVKSCSKLASDESFMSDGGVNNSENSGHLDFGDRILIPLLNKNCSNFLLDCLECSSSDKKGDLDDEDAIEMLANTIIKQALDRFDSIHCSNLQTNNHTAGGQIQASISTSNDNCTDNSNEYLINKMIPQSTPSSQRCMVRSCSFVLSLACVDLIPDENRTRTSLRRTRSASTLSSYDEFVEVDYLKDLDVLKGQLDIISTEEEVLPTNASRDPAEQMGFSNFIKEILGREELTTCSSTNCKNSCGCENEKSVHNVQPADNATLLMKQRNCRDSNDDSFSERHVIENVSCSPYERLSVLQVDLKVINPSCSEVSDHILEAMRAEVSDSSLPLTEKKVLFNEDSTESLDHLPTSKIPIPLSEISKIPDLTISTNTNKERLEFGMNCMVSTPVDKELPDKKICDISFNSTISETGSLEVADQILKEVLESSDSDHSIVWKKKVYMCIEYIGDFSFNICDGITLKTLVPEGE